MAHPTRFKRDAHLQGCAAGAYSTCHAGLLASVARGFHGAAHSGEVPPETRHHTQVAVVFVECSSRTLPKSWQLCRKCTITTPSKYRTPRPRRCSEESRWTSIWEEKRNTNLPEHTLHPIRR